MECDFIDDFMFYVVKNDDRIYNHIEELEKEYEELSSDFDE